MSGVKSAAPRDHIMPVGIRPLAQNRSPYSTAVSVAVYSRIGMSRARQSWEPSSKCALDRPLLDFAVFSLRRPSMSRRQCVNVFTTSRLTLAYCVEEKMRSPSPGVLWRDEPCSPGLVLMNNFIHRYSFYDQRLADHDEIKLLGNGKHFGKP
jgi:hypothetical protein